MNNVDKLDRVQIRATNNKGSGTESIQRKLEVKEWQALNAHLVQKFGGTG